MCEAIDIKTIFFVNKTHFHNKGNALRLIFESKSFWNSETAYYSNFQRNVQM